MFYLKRDTHSILSGVNHTFTENFSLFTYHYSTEISKTKVSCFDTLVKILNLRKNQAYDLLRQWRCQDFSGGGAEEGFCGHHSDHSPSVKINLTFLWGRGVQGAPILRGRYTCLPRIDSYVTPSFQNFYIRLHKPPRS